MESFFSGNFVVSCPWKYLPSYVSLLIGDVDVLVLMNTISCSTMPVGRTRRSECGYPIWMEPPSKPSHTPSFSSGWVPAAFVRGDWRAMNE